MNKHVDKNFNKRRLFFGYDESLFQILTFEQNKQGDIYCCFPNMDFCNTRWQLLENNKDGPKLQSLDSMKEDGKLSIHASGQVHLRSHQGKNPPSLLIKGALPQLRGHFKPS